MRASCSCPMTGRTRASGRGSGRRLRSRSRMPSTTRGFRPGCAASSRPMPQRTPTRRIAAGPPAEATLIGQASTLRESDLRGLVERWLGLAGAKMLQLVRQTLTLDLWVQLKGFSDSEFQAFLTSAGAQAMLHLQYGPEMAQQMTQALQTNVLLQQRFRERYGQVRPFRVTREQLQCEADVQVLPASARPLQQAQLLRLVGILGPLAF